MRVIDSDNYAESGIETFFFPGGEPHAKIPENFGDALLFLKPRTWNDIGLATCVLGALYYQGYAKRRKVWLFCPYFPGARQDRTDYRTPVTRELMARILGQYVNRLYTFDLHSSPRFMGVHLEKNFMPADMLSWVHNGGQYIIAPDKGAKDRALSFANHMRSYNGKQGGVQVIQADKVRDFDTGKITGYSLPPLPGVGCYTVVDDICDGGATFNMLADAFLKDPSGEGSKLVLWVSHGIFSKGPSNLHHKYSDIMTTDSWCKMRWNPVTDGPWEQWERVNVIPLKPIIDKILEESEDV